MDISATLAIAVGSPWATALVHYTLGQGSTSHRPRRRPSLSAQFCTQEYRARPRMPASGHRYRLNLKPLLGRQELVMNDCCPVSDWVTGKPMLATGSNRCSPIVQIPIISDRKGREAGIDLLKIAFKGSPLNSLQNQFGVRSMVNKLVTTRSGNSELGKLLGFFGHRTSGVGLKVLDHFAAS